MKSRIKTALTVVAAAIVVVYVLNSLIDNPYTHRILRAALNEKIQKNMDLSIEYKDIKLNIFPLNIILFGLKVRQHHHDGSLLEAAHLKLELSVVALLMGKTRLSLLEFNELRIHLPFKEKKIIMKSMAENLEEGMKFYWPPSFDLPIDRIIGLNSHISFRIKGHRKIEKYPVFEMIADGVNFDLNYSSWNQFSLQYEVSILNLLTSGRKLVDQGHLLGKVEFNDDRWRSHYFELKSDRLNWKGDLNGEISTNQKKVSGQYAKSSLVDTIKLRSKLLVSRSHLSILGNYLGLERTSGTTTGNVNIVAEIPLSSPSDVTWVVRGDSHIDDAVLNGFNLNTADVKFIVDSEQIIFSEASLIKDGKENSRFSGKIVFNEQLDINIKGRIKNTPLTQLLSSLKIDEFDIFNMNLNSREFRVEGTGSPLSLVVSGNASISNISITHLEKKEKPLISPNCQFELKILVNEVAVHFDPSALTCLPSAAEFTEDKDPSIPSEMMLGGTFYQDNKKGMDLFLKSNSISLELLGPFVGLPMLGNIGASVVMKGPVEKLRLSGTVSGKSTMWNGVQLDHFHSKFIVNIPDSILISERTEIRLEGNGRIDLRDASFQIARPYRFDGKLIAKKVRKKTVSSIFNLYFPETDVAFFIKNLETNLNGFLSYPLSSLGTIDFTINDLHINGESFFTSLQGSLLSRKKGWTSKNILYESGNFSMDLKFDHLRNRRFSLIQFKKLQDPLSKWGVEGQDQLTLSIDTGTLTQELARTHQFQQDHIGKLPVIGKYLSNRKMTGMVVLQADLKGNLEKLQGRFSGGIHNPAFDGSPITPLQFSGFVDGSHIDIPNLSQGGNSLIGRLEFDFLKEGIPYSWYFHFNDFDVRALGSQLLNRDPRNFAYLTAKWNMQGRFSDFWYSSGKIDIDRIKIKFVSDGEERFEKVEISMENPVTINISRDGWMFQGDQSLVMKSDLLTVRLETRENHPPENLGILISGELNASTLKKLSPLIEMGRGKVVMNGELSNSITDPKFYLRIKNASDDLKNMLSVGIKDYPPSFSNIELDVEFENGEVRINSLTADKGSQGRLNLSGVIASGKNEKETRLLASFDKVKVSRLPFSIFKSIEAELSGDLLLTNINFPLNLSGHIVIDRAESFGSFDVREQILAALRRQKISNFDAPKEPILNLDISISADETIRIKNRNLEAHISCQLQIKGDENSPIILGQITIPKGSFNYKREFKLTRGNIIFDEVSSVVDPKFDITGISEINPYTVEVTVTGKSSAPLVTLTVDPATRPDGSLLEKVDILLLLSTGKLPDSDRTLQGSVVMGEVMNLFVGQLEDPIEKLFDLSGQKLIRQVYLDTYLPKDGDGNPVVRVNFPISVGEDLNLILQGDQDSNAKLSLKYYLHDSITVSGSLDNREEVEGNSNFSGDTGMDLKFRFTFP